MKLLLMVTAVLETAAGLALLVMPSVAVSILLGVPLETPAGLVAGRIAGTALVALAVACWQTKDGERSTSTAVVEAMLFYNFAAAVVLAYAGIVLELRSGPLWPAIVLHLGLGAWCLLSLWFTSRKSKVRTIITHPDEPRTL
jgi:Kef-type K+ transport system membrane component KefB